MTERAEDLVVFSHLKWEWVWQRPQHLCSRIGRGRRLWFVEEPAPADVPAPVVRVVEEPHGVRRVVLEVPRHECPTDRHLGFDDPCATEYGDALAELVDRPTIAWLYTALALPLATALEPRVLVFDVMDDLAAFQGASPLLRERHADAVARADVVFTGGRSLHARTTSIRTRDVHCFPSGVETRHYAGASPLRAARLATARHRPTAGYVGVVDERLDLDLLAGLADAMPDWDIEIVGPVAKIDPATLPQRSNLRYRGAVSYGGLPEAMARFDVALMPFALNEATRSISPTKTLEYLAADLPVVSTRVPDVVADYADVVLLADDAAGFEHACRIALVSDRAHRRALVAPVLERNEWDTIAATMETLVSRARVLRAARSRSALHTGRVAS